MDSPEDFAVEFGGDAVLGPTGGPRVFVGVVACLDHQNCGIPALDQFHRFLQIVQKVDPSFARPIVDIADSGRKGHAVGLVGPVVRVVTALVQRRWSPCSCTRRVSTGIHKQVGQSDTDVVVPKLALVGRVKAPKVLERQSSRETKEQEE